MENFFDEEQIKGIRVMVNGKAKVFECVCMRVCMHVNESVSTRVYVKVCECVCVLLKVVPDGSRKESQSQRFPW